MSNAMAASDTKTESLFADQGDIIDLGNTFDLSVFLMRGSHAGRFQPIPFGGSTYSNGDERVSGDFYYTYGITNFGGIGCDVSKRQANRFVVINTNGSTDPIASSKLPKGKKGRALFLLPISHQDQIDHQGPLVLAYQNLNGAFAGDFAITYDNYREKLREHFKGHIDLPFDPKLFLEERHRSAGLASMVSKLWLQQDADTLCAQFHKAMVEFAGGRNEATWSDIRAALETCNNGMLRMHEYTELHSPVLPRATCRGPSIADIALAKK
jgi:hypothetical protein